MTANAPAAQTPDIDAVRTYLTGLQTRIVTALEGCDGSRFETDAWQRPEGGGGITRVIEEGQVLERGSVLFSHVRGDRLPASASAHRQQIAGRPFEAMGVSLVIPPRNPAVPPVHLNVRFFLAFATNEPGQSEPIWWFGGGMDLTPYYPFEEDARHFHRVCKASLVAFGDDTHARYTKWCDDYFFLKPRNEARGVGGIFFDDLSEPGFEQSFALMQSVGNAFTDAYVPIVERRKHLAWGDRERDFQAYRRGRYVEFNLVFDRGTLFGLQSGGRTESILCSMPPVVRWRYNWHPDPGSPESKLYDFLKPRDWA